MMCVAEDSDKDSSEELLEKEKNTPEDKLRTMGRKQFIPYGLYEVKGFISANLAQETGFDEEDFNILFEAIMNMYEHDRSASKGMMTVISPIIIFKHIGTDSDDAQRKWQSKLGCASAQSLFRLINAKKKDEVEYPRSLEDYVITIEKSKLPKGIEIGYKTSALEGIEWSEMAETPTYIKIK